MPNPLDPRCLPVHFPYRNDVKAHLQAREVFIETSDEQRGDFTYIGYPARIDYGGYGDIARAPRHGEHTEQVLSSVGVSPDEIADLRARGQVR